MKIFYMLLFSLFFVPLANAEMWVKHDAGKIIRRYSGDCYRAGFCGVNNSSLAVGWIQVSKIDYQLAGNKYYKVENDVVTEMTQAEKDAILAAEAQAVIDAENARITSLDDSMAASQSIRLTKIENNIDNIGNLEDAKTFLKKLCRYIARS